MRLSVLVISFNTQELTLACLDSIYRQTTLDPIEVFVWDNNSTDGSADAIASRFPQARLIRSEQNLGFARANNEAARSASGEFFLLLNPDTLVTDRAIDRLYATALENVPSGSFAIFGGRTIFPDGLLNPASCWRSPTIWSTFCFAIGLTRLFPSTAWFNPEAYGGWDRRTAREVEMVSGCFLLMHRSLWNTLGGFDEAFFMYGEDADLCWRARRAGARCLICPEACIVHYGGASEPIRAEKMIRLFRAKAMLFQRQWGPLAQRCGIILLDLCCLVRMTAFGAAGLLHPRARSAFRIWRAIWRERAAWRIEPVTQSRHLVESTPLATGAA